MSWKIFVQARMSSARFPGKVLAPFLGKPIIQHVIDSLTEKFEKVDIVVLTSDEQSDDPLVAYLEKQTITYFRGELDNVFNRFSEALNHYPVDWFVRISADSPYINPEIIGILLDKRDERYDLITNVFKRTFPKGQSVELVKSKSFLAINQNDLTQSDKEHVTPWFYQQASNYHILSLYLNETHTNNFCIDTLDDLKRLEKKHNSFNFNRQNLMEEIV